VSIQFVNLNDDFRAKVRKVIVIFLVLNMNLNILLVYLVLSVILLIIEIHATSTESPQTNNSSDSVSISTSVVTGMSFQYKSENKKVFYGTNGQPSIGEGEDVKITMYGSFPKTKLKVLVTTRKSCDHPGDKCKYVSVCLLFLSYV